MTCNLDNLIKWIDRNEKTYYCEQCECEYGDTEYIKYIDKEALLEFLIKIYKEDHNEMD